MSIEVDPLSTGPKLGDFQMWEFASAYARLGWRVIPLHEPLFNEAGECVGCTCEAWRRKKQPDFVCSSPGKHPRINRWQDRATCNEAIIISWWRKTPTANIGIVAGQSGLIALDADKYKEGGGELALEEKVTPTSLTGGGGEHLIYKHPEDGPKLGNSAGELPDWVDVRGWGGQFVVPPSLHPSGRRYEWEEGYDPHQVEPAALPADIRAILTEAAEAASEHNVIFSEDDMGKPDLSQFKPISQGMRAIIEHGTPNGSDRSQLEQSVITALIGSGASPDEVKGIFDHYAIGGPGSHYAEHAKPAEYLAKSIEKADAWLAKQNGQVPTAPTAPTLDILAYQPEDGGILDAWLDLYGSEWLYAVGFDDWHLWAGTHWQPDQALQLEGQIQALMDAMNEQARQRMKTEEDANKAKIYKPYVAATKRSSWRMESVLRLARSQRAVPAERLDLANVLNLANGTLDLERHELRPHNPDDLLTYCLGYDYSPAAQAPSWAVCLRRLSGAVGSFLQEFAGYALTTDTSLETAVWLYGPPGGGKSTFIAGLQAMLGDKAGLLGLADIENNRFALAALPGKTLVVATEQPERYLASTHVVNAIVSGEPVIVDRKFRDAIQIRPRAKIAWAMNELPRIGGANDGIYRRVKVVRFAAIPEAERDPDMVAAVMSEAPGILNWALAGLQRLRQRGRFDVPKEVQEATQDFVTGNDVPAAFVEECCLVGPDYSTGASQLYRAYREWAIETGHKPQSATSIANDWNRLGFDRYRAKGRSYWRGVGLKSEAEYDTIPF